VECVSLANNHTMDLGQKAYDTTRTVLQEAGVAFAGDWETTLVETERGLKIGVLCVSFYIERDTMANRIADLKEQGAQIVIVSFHWGIEGTYHHTYDQTSYAYDAIDAGANIVFGHHPHVLQEIEAYNGGMIYYSLGNFAFGGNDCPKDFDTAFISQEVIVDVDGTVSLGTCTPVPCCISPFDNTNKYQPTPAEEGSARYERVMDKLSGNYYGPNIAPTDPTEEETTGETTVSTEETAGDVTEVPEEETAAPTDETEAAGDETTAPAEEDSGE
jgi:poly-gamma-glutamate synthesis protein (capsule biosynthesis protein)